MHGPRVAMLLGVVLVIAGCAVLASEASRRASSTAPASTRSASADMTAAIGCTSRRGCPHRPRWSSCCTAASAALNRPKDPTAGTNWPIRPSSSSPTRTASTGPGTSTAEAAAAGPPRRTSTTSRFITAAVADIAKNVSIDASRVYATGMSNGGMMSYTLACDTTLFAAIGPVSGTQLDPCRLAAPGVGHGDSRHRGSADSLRWRARPWLRPHQRPADTGAECVLAQGRSMPSRRPSRPAVRSPRRPPDAPTIAAWC